MVRLNPKSVTLDVQEEGRELKWHVSYGLLYRILNGQASPTEDLLIDAAHVVEEDVPIIS